VYSCYYFFFFFFQAEDGIRDLTVTGVQTCALPIYPAFDEEARQFVERWIGQEAHDKNAFDGLDYDEIIRVADARPYVLQWVLARSEERRVGKECRCRWATDE